LNKIDIEIDKVKSRLKQLNRKIKFIDLLKGLLLLVLVAFVINITLPTLELLGLNSVKDRTILFFAGVVVFVFAFIVLLVMKTNTNRI
jgi:uncharacterized membrane protein